MKNRMDTVEEKEVCASSSQPEASVETVDLYDVLVLLARRRRMIAFTTLVSLLVGLGLCFKLTPYFTATAVILPPQQQSPSSALLGQLGSLAAAGSGASALGLKSPADLYIGILESRTIADRLIAQFNLQSVYKQKSLTDTRVQLKSHTAFDAGKDGLIHIAVTDADPRRASDLANGYLDQLYLLNSELAVAEAGQRRAFFQQQIDSQKKDLATAEDQLHATEQKTGMIQVSGQAQAIIESITRLRAQIESREVELQSIKVSSTDQNPSVIRLREEISTMRAQLEGLENNQQRQEPAGDLAESAGSLAQGSLEFARKYREVKYQETLNDLLSRQYETARIDEAKSAPIIQVIDHATPPDQKTGPKRLLIVIGCLLVGFLGACIWTFVAHFWTAMQQSPEVANKLEGLRRTLR
ncbi:MAG TPA: Wzz/FepE/Etk N-terminal domain-containing protein [Acidobacteriaceae bacterium]|nr:Wzz/FepE/Etk N-terminal domain-containing protein [Acidobacteriaceae bacterium]